MEIKGKVHLFFEQSATFRDEFRKLGYEAFDYDIQNNFGETDYQIDLFAEIEKAYDGKGSVFDSITKMVSVSIMRGIPMIMENPWAEQTFLKANFVQAPTIIDKDRRRRGDYFMKPTAYWFFNCEPTSGKSFQKQKETKIVNNCKKGKEAGICSEERSMISPDYARNFIHDFILGKPQKHTQLELF